MCLGAMLMLLSTFRMDKFLRSTLPGITKTLTLSLKFWPLLACRSGVMMQLSMPCGKPCHCSFFPTRVLATHMRSGWGVVVPRNICTRAGRIHLSARRSVEHLPFADTALLSSNQSSPRRLSQPFKGHTFTTARSGPQNKSTSNPAQGTVATHGTAERSQLQQTPGTSGRPKGPAEESSTEGRSFFISPNTEVMLRAPGPGSVS